MVKKVCIVGASGKLGRYMVRHALDRGYEVVGVCREKDFARFMVEALENDELAHEAPAIVGCRTPSALAHAGDRGRGADPIGRRERSRP